MVTRFPGARSTPAVACAAAIGLTPAIAAAQSPHFAPPPLYAAPPADDERDRVETMSLPFLRVTGGPAMNLQPGRAMSAAAVIEENIGVRYAARRRLIVSFEATYTLELSSTPAGHSGDRHLGSAGVGPAFYQSKFFTIGWTPKLVFGGSSEGFAIGARNSLVTQLVYHFVLIDVGHQWLHVGGRDEHQLRALVGTDLFGLFILGLGTPAENMAETR